MSDIMKQILQLTEYKSNIPVFVMKNQVVSFAWMGTYSEVCLKSSMRLTKIKVNEAPLDILQNIHALKFTSFENGHPLYVSKDMIIAFRQYDYNDSCTVISLDSIIGKTPAYIGVRDKQLINYIRVKETPEEIEKIIDADCSQEETKDEEVCTHIKVQRRFSVCFV